MYACVLHGLLVDSKICHVCLTSLVVHTVVVWRFTFVGIRLLGYGVTESDEASALVFQKDHISIYSNSWGPPDYGYTLDPIPNVVKAALYEGVTQVRK